MSASMALHPTEDLTSDAYAYRWLFPRDGERLFPGLLALVLAGIAIARRRPGSLFPAVALVVMVLLSLGPRLELGQGTLALPYAWLYAIPPFDGMRHPYTCAWACSCSRGWPPSAGRGSPGGVPWAGPRRPLAVADAEPAARRAGHPSGKPRRTSCCGPGRRP